MSRQCHDSPPSWPGAIRIIEITTRKAVNDILAGRVRLSVFKGRGMEFDEVREYQPGDDVRTIDWNVTARTGRPYVKRFVEERELTVMLLVDLSASGAFGSAAAQQERGGRGALRPAGLLRHQEQRQGGPDRLHRPGGAVHPARARAAARAAPDPRAPGLRAGKRRRGTDIAGALETLSAC